MVSLFWNIENSVDESSTLLLELRPRQRQCCQFRPPRNLSRGQPDPLGPLRTLPPPYPLPRTSGRTLSWHTSDQTCDPIEPRLLQSQLYCSTCRHLSAL